MTRARVRILIGVLVAVLCCGCNGEDWTRKGYQEVVLPVSICLPVEDVYGPQNAPERRAFGDPGTTEKFALPLYVYYFIVKQNADESWVVWDVQTKSVNDESGSAAEQLEAWKAKWDTIPYRGVYDKEDDMVFRLNEKIVTLLPSEGFNGRVYAVASAVDLDFYPPITEGSTTEATLLGLTFRFDGTEAYDSIVRSNLQNIYSTPHNYTYNGKYYGSFSKDVNVSYINLLLYHVASKVDLMWNVTEAKRDSVKISYVAANNLYDGPCYVFKPTENVIGDYATYAAAGHTGYTVKLLDEKKPCPGTQWNGRAYFYAIPYKNNDLTYPLQIRLQKDGDSSSGGNYYWSVVQTDVSTVWTSWIRGQITINNGKYNITP